MSRTISQPIFSFPQVDRKAAFRIVTAGYRDDNGDVIVTKKPLHDDAIPHIRALSDTYARLEKISKPKVFTVVPCEVKDDIATFPLIRGDHIDRVLFEATLNEDSETIRSVVSHIGKLVDSFPSSKRNPADNKDFVSVFGDSFDEKQECLEFGILDLNFDNILVDASDNWQLIDYEWAFDFPLPKDYVLARIYWYFILRYSQYFHLYANRIKILEIGEGLYCPESLFKHIEDILRSCAESYVATESAFQSYVIATSKSIHEGELLFDEPRPAASIPEFYIDHRERLHTEQLQHAKDLEQHISSLEDERDYYKKFHDAIIESRSYKIAQKMSDFKGKISPQS